MRELVLHDDPPWSYDPHSPAIAPPNALNNARLPAIEGVLISHETEKRRATARRVVEVLAAKTGLSASLLAGSAAQGTCDEHSDIDLLNYYSELPDRGAFDALMRGLGAVNA